MKKPYWILIGITCAFLCLVLGIFIGRHLSDTNLTIEDNGSANSVVSQGNKNDATGSSESENKDGKVNINTATAKQLQLLPGIGEVIAQRIVDYRYSYGACYG